MSIRKSRSQSKKKRKPKNKRPRLLRGIISVSSKGVGYFPSEEFKEDIEIGRELLNTAFHGDEVEVAIGPLRKVFPAAIPDFRLQLRRISQNGSRRTHSTPSNHFAHAPSLARKSGISRRNGFPKRSIPSANARRIQGEVMRVLKRAKIEFIGVVDKTPPGKTFVVPDDRKAYVDFVLEGAGAQGVESGDKVLVRLQEWSDAEQAPKVRLLRVIGKAGEHDTEVVASALAFGFEQDFPRKVKMAAEDMMRMFDINLAVKGRRDFRGIPTFTIDPEDAKDFDDALSVSKLPNGNIEIGVHIADVSYFVLPDGALDQEAASRGCSVYLVDRTVHMLPAELSEGLCSLKPSEDRPAFSAVFELDKYARIKVFWLGKSIIRSVKRFAYEEAQKEIDAVEEGGELTSELKILNSLAKILKEKRREAGAIDFEEEEMRFELDMDMRPVRVYRKKRLDAHKLIEEFMLLANRAVAEYIYKHSQKLKKELPFVYRVHGLPDREKIDQLYIFVRSLGHQFKFPKSASISPKDISALLESMEGHPGEALVRMAALRAMAKAIYTTNNTGHFGLAFSHYTHFTSPIRRYPDILVHRMLERYLSGETVHEREIKHLEKESKHSSLREIGALEAERASVRFKQVEYMKPREGEVFEAVISGLTNWGMYVEDKETKIEGMVRLNSLKDDYYALDEKNYRLVGERSGKVYSLGDPLSVKLVAANIERRTLDFEVV